MYKNGFDVANGDIIQALSADFVTLTDIIFKMTYIASLNLELNNILTCDVRNVKNASSADIIGLKKSKILTPVETINRNWMHGSSPRFSQNWRR